MTGGDTVSEASRVLSERLPLYQRAAHLQIDTAGLTPSQIVEEILARYPGTRSGQHIIKTR